MKYIDNKYNLDLSINQVISTIDKMKFQYTSYESEGELGPYFTAFKDTMLPRVQLKLNSFII